mmetsp:Transcript_17985/g.30596  ORF Transcript_17985/g.30596 Transcript_17985/m.30596 type:complete len:2161 (-) Transcript_17985:3045-9527(-)
MVARLTSLLRCAGIIEAGSDASGSASSEDSWAQMLVGSVGKDFQWDAWRASFHERKKDAEDLAVVRRRQKLLGYLDDIKNVENKQGRLSWSNFVDGRQGAKAGLRKTFSEFIRLCSVLSGGDEEAMIGEQLEEAAFALYSGFSGPNKLRKVDIEQMFGVSARKSDVVAARDLAAVLVEWDRANPSNKRVRRQPYAVLDEEVPNPEKEDHIDDQLADTDDFVEEGETGGTSASINESDWLIEQCNFHLMKLDNAVMSGDELADTILGLLRSKRSDDDLQGDFLDLLGISDGTFEFMMALFEKRPRLVLASTKKANENGDVGGSYSKRDRSQEAPVFAPSQRSPSNAGPAQRFAVMTDQNYSGPRVALPNTRPGGRPAGTKEEHIEHIRITGPGAGAEDEEVGKGKYVQVFIPASKRNRGRNAKDALVPIDAFAESVRVAFRGIKSLNRLQSAVFEKAYFTNHNLLICAPTGAGKTNVAMTTVVREVERHLDDISEVKIIYVAPMKALAQEVVEKFGARLKPLGVRVRELTGDMQLTKKEIEETQLIVTTPEKWDVITRKSGDGTLVERVGLLIIDEVHLVGEDRGPVIESLIARTLRLVEQKQKMVRIVGLSATLPNYKDVARFLRVDMQHGLFYFDNSFRPVPLDQTFIGVIEKNLQKKLAMLNDIAFNKAVESVRAGNQVMIFVHSRKDTAKTARAILEAATKVEHSMIFADSAPAASSEARKRFEKDVAKSKNGEVRQFFAGGVGIHHAGMALADRKLSAKMFSNQAISVLCCTATLAWGVNLPVHTVIIKGTQVYVAEKGGLVELNMQDVFQCFGRAGRPQFDTSGEAILITEHDQLNRYLSMLNGALPLESKLDKHLADALNAEIVSGTVTNLQEAVEWLSYTFLYIRMMLNPLQYGVTHKEKEMDPTLLKRRAQLLVAAARELDRARMSRFALGGSGRMSMSMNAAMPDLQAPFGVTDMGRVASHYYIGHATIEVFNTKLKPHMEDCQMIDLLCHASEFDNLRLREEEIVELNKLHSKACPIEVLAPIDSPKGKAAILLQTYITGYFIQTFSLASDMNYISQNMGRVARAVFEICMKKRWSSMAEKTLALCTALDKRCWWEPYAHPLRQFSPRLLQPDTIQRLEERGESCNLERLIEMSASEVGHIIRQNAKIGDKILRCCRRIPYLEVEVRLQPLTRTILRVSVDIYPEFEWHDKFHGNVQSFWIWVEDQKSEWIYHSERIMLRKQDYKKALEQQGKEKETAKTNQHPALLAASTDIVRREFAIPVFEPLPPQYFLRICSDSWLGAESVVPLTLSGLVLPEKTKQHTDLLQLDPLPRTALKNAEFESLYTSKFTHFNPIQTQIFHTMYHRDDNVLLGAPTGSGKTISSELALLRVFKEYPDLKTVYIAPLKALVSERIKEWKKTIGERLGKNIVEFTGDVTPDPSVLRRADVLITTPEKWDGASRMWKRREYVKMVRLVIIDEIHLLGEERGAVLEVLVTRMRYIAETTGNPVRIVGLSTALANAQDLGNWLGIKNNLGLYNFRPAVRPVPLEAHIHGFPGKHYCPRMATMNKPTYQAILTHSPEKPTLVFVASRRQTRLTALDLIALCAASDNPRRFLHMPFENIEVMLPEVTDETLRHTLAFGIGIHHAGLNSADRDVVENLFVSGKIQVLVCTSTLAWGVNFPAHLVVIKGTEYFDAKTKRYQPFPVTDVLQMMGRAGRPQFDTTGVAMIFVEESLKDFYKKFLYEPFPVESHLPEFLHNHLNAEIAAGSISSERDALDYLSWTYFFRRLPMNPSYYGLDKNDPDSVAVFLVEMIRKIVLDLTAAGCLTISENLNVLRSPQGKLNKWSKADTVTSTTRKEFLDKKLKNILVDSTRLGRIASFYYLDYRSIGTFKAYFDKPGKYDSVVELTRQVFELLCGAHEYSEVPVRHNEDVLNLEFSKILPWNPFKLWPVDSPYAKTSLLLQAHCKKAPIPIKDYIGDTKSVLDQALRVLNAIVECALVYGRKDCAIAGLRISQCIVQGCWFTDSPLSQLRSVSHTLFPPSESLLRTLQVDSKMAAKLTSSARGSLKSLPIVDFSVHTGLKPTELKIDLAVVNHGSISKRIPFGLMKNKVKGYSWWIILANDAVVLFSKHLFGLPSTLSLRYEIEDVKPTRAYLVSGSVRGLDQELEL